MHSSWPLPELNIHHVLTDWNFRLRNSTPPDQFNRTCWVGDRGQLEVLADTGRPDRFLIRFGGLASFEISFDECLVMVAREQWDLPNETPHHLLVDQVLPRIIAHQGRLVLHASAVAVDTGAILFLGPTGQGKSTIAASLHQAGYSLLGDDAIVLDALETTPQAQAVYPSLRLLPDALSSIFPGERGTGGVAHYSKKKRVLQSGELRAALGAFPVDALFFLQEADQISVRPRSAAHACMGVIEHSFWMDPEDRSATRKKLAQASQLASLVPAYDLAFPRTFDCLEELRAVILSVMGNT